MKRLFLLVAVTALITFADGVPDSLAARNTITCSHGRSACLLTGGTTAICAARYQRCMRDSCFDDGQVLRCGYYQR